MMWPFSSGSSHPHRTSRRGPARRGFSLLEVMVALAILVVSLSILLETQASSTIVTPTPSPASAMTAPQGSMASEWP